MITSIIVIIAGISHILPFFAAATIETLKAFCGSVTELADPLSFFRFSESRIKRSRCEPDAIEALAAVPGRVLN